MNELRDLYQEVILDHYKKPRNYQADKEANHQAEGRNPICGDQITIYAQLDENNQVSRASFQGAGCAISQASCSMMTEAVKGKSKEEVLALFEKFHTLVTQDVDPDTLELGKLQVFAGIRDFPVRVKCASLAWHTLRAALEKEDELVSTE